MAEGGLEEKDIEDSVICPVCFEYMLDSRTLYPCGHTFCTRCVSGLDTRRERYQTGISCPLCRGFVPIDEVRENRLMNLLIFLLTKEELNPPDVPKCMSCCSPNITERCLHCQFDLCGRCSDGHKRLPGFKEHKIVYLSQIDNQDNERLALVFCKSHPNKLIEMNCKTCNLAVCAQCKFLEHDSHESETLENALDRYKITAEKALSNLSKIISSKKKRLQSIAEAKTAVVENENTLVAKLQTHRDKIKQEVISIIDREYDSLTSTLKSNVITQLKELDLEEISVDQSVTKDESFHINAKGTIDTTDGIPLVLKLQSGLLNEMQQFQNQQISDDVECTLFDFQQSLELYNSTLLGNITKHEINMQEHGLSVIPEERTPDLSSLKMIYANSFRKVTFDTNLIRVKSFTLQDSFNTSIDSVVMCLFQNKLWVPSTSYNKILLKVFSLDGNLEDTFNLDSTYIKPIHSLHPLDEQEILLASVSGLYTLNSNGKLNNRLHSGNFDDVCVNDGIVAALSQGKVMIWDVTSLAEEPKFTFSITSKNQNQPLSVYLQNNYIYISYISDITVNRYSIRGQHINSFSRVVEGHNAFCRLCTMDSKGNILLADHNNNCLQVMSATGIILPFNLRVNCPRDVIFVGNSLYVLQNGGNIVSIYNIEKTI